MNSHIVVQQYLQRPLLLDGYKFDLRLYVLLTNVSPNLEIYVFNDGLVRLSTNEYERPD